MTKICLPERDWFLRISVEEFFKRLREYRGVLFPYEGVEITHDVSDSSGFRGEIGLYYSMFDSFRLGFMSSNKIDGHYGMLSRSLWISGRDGS